MAKEKVLEYERNHDVFISTPRDSRGRLLMHEPSLGSSTLALNVEYRVRIANSPMVLVELRYMCDISRSCH